MKIGFVRLSRAGPALDVQLAALEQVGIPLQDTDQRIFIDDQRVGRGVKEKTAFKIACGQLHEGDELVISTLSRLGSNYIDVLESVVAICERKASVYIADTKQLISHHITIYDLHLIAEAGEQANRAEIAEKMLQARASSGAVGGAPDKLTGDLLEKAKVLWADSSLTASDVADRVGVARRTLYRRLGARTEKDQGSQ